jgi:hypothetical protein
MESLPSRLIKSGCKKLSVLFFPFREQTPM